MNEWLFLVVLQHEMDDVPLRLFTTFEEAERFARAADWSPPENITRSLAMFNMSTPSCISVIKFFDGIPCHRTIVRDFEAEDGALEEALRSAKR